MLSEECFSPLRLRTPNHSNFGDAIGMKRGSSNSLPAANVGAITHKMGESTKRILEEIKEEDHEHNNQDFNNVAGKLKQ